MKHIGSVMSVSVLLMVTSLAYARGGGHSGGHSAFGHHTSRHCATYARDRHGRIQRDARAKQEFMN